MANAAEIGRYIMGRLREMKSRQECIADVRGLGLMIGIEIAREKSNPWPELRDKIVVECFNRGLILQGAGQSAIRLSPPLIIEKEQADFALKTLEESFQFLVSSF
jgi:4-aminobutyrate aminotransferase